MIWFKAKLINSVPQELKVCACLIKKNQSAKHLFILLLKVCVSFTLLSMQVMVNGSITNMKMHTQ